MNQIKPAQIVIVTQLLSDEEMHLLFNDRNIKVVIFIGDAILDVDNIDTLRLYGKIVDCCITESDMMYSIHAYLNMHKYSIVKRSILYPSTINTAINRKKVNGVMYISDITEDTKNVLISNGIKSIQVDDLNNGQCYISLIREIRKDIGLADEGTTILELDDIMIMSGGNIRDIKFTNTVLKSDIENIEIVKPGISSNKLELNPKIINTHRVVLSNDHMFEIAHKMVTEYDLYTWVKNRIDEFGLGDASIEYVVRSYINKSEELMRLILDMFYVNKDDSSIKFTMISLLSDTINAVELLYRYSIIEDCNIAHATYTISDIPLSLTKINYLPYLSKLELSKLDLTDINLFKSDIYLDPKLTRKLARILIVNIDKYGPEIVCKFINDIPYLIYDIIHIDKYSEYMAKIGVVDNFIYINREYISMHVYLEHMQNMTVSTFNKLINSDQIKYKHKEYIINNKNISNRKRTLLLNRLKTQLVINNEE